MESTRKIEYVTFVYMDYIEGQTLSAVHCYLKVVADLFLVSDIFVFLAAGPRMGNGYSNDDNLLCLKKRHPIRFHEIRYSYWLSSAQSGLHLLCHHSTCLNPYWVSAALGTILLSVH